MNSQNYPKCPKCLNPYETRENGCRPCIGTCGHTICLPCKSTIPSSRCPIPECNKPDAFAVTTFNISLLDFIRLNSCKQNSNSDASACPICKCTSQDLRICKQCGLDDGYLEVEVTDEQQIRIRSYPENKMLSDINLAKARSMAKCPDCFLRNGPHQHGVTIDLHFLEMKFNFSQMQQLMDAQICRLMNNLIMQLTSLPNSVVQRRDNFFQGLAQFDRDDWPLERQYLERHRQISHAISLELNIIRQFFPNILRILDEFNGTRTRLEDDDVHQDPSNNNDPRFGFFDDFEPPSDDDNGNENV